MEWESQTKVIFVVLQMSPVYSYPIDENPFNQRKLVSIVALDEEKFMRCKVPGVCVSHYDEYIYIWVTERYGYASYLILHNVWK